MNQEILTPIVRGMNNVFNSHDLIKELMNREPVVYNELKDRYNDVRIVHSQIGISLSRLAEKLGIEKTGVISDDSLGYPSKCAIWRTLF